MDIRLELRALMGKKLPKKIGAMVASSNGTPLKNKQESGHLHRQGKKRAHKSELAQREERERKHNLS